MEVNTTAALLPNPESREGCLEWGCFISPPSGDTGGCNVRVIWGHHVGSHTQAQTWCSHTHAHTGLRRITNTHTHTHTHTHTDYECWCSKQSFTFTRVFAPLTSGSMFDVSNLIQRPCPLAIELSNIFFASFYSHSHNYDHPISQQIESVVGSERDEIVCNLLV